jgi:hypothetical protein
MIVVVISLFGEIWLSIGGVVVGRRLEWKLMYLQREITLVLIGNENIDTKINC